MNYLELKYHLVSEQDVERILYVRVYKLVDDEDKSDRILEVLNVPFFVEEDHLKNLFKNENIEIEFVNNKTKTDKLRNKVALVEFNSKKELKNELRLIKYSDEDEKLYLYRSKVSSDRFVCMLNCSF